MPGSSNFPIALDTVSNLPDPDPTTLLDESNPLLDHHYQHGTVNAAVRAIEERVGIINSANTSTIDYGLYNTSSVDPGHKHSLASLSDFNIAAPSNGQAMVYDNGSGKWVNTTISTLAIGNTIGNSPAPNGILYSTSNSLLANTSLLAFNPVTNTLVMGLPLSDALARAHFKSADATAAGRFEGLGNNTLYQALTLLNNDVPVSGELGQAVLFDLLLMRNGGVDGNSTGVGGRFSVGKEADWTGVNLAGAQANRSAYFAISTVTAGNTTEKMRVTGSGPVLVGTTTTTGSSLVQVAGGIRIGANADAASVAGGGALRYNTSVIEFSNGSSWAAIGSGGGGGSLTIGSAVGGSIARALLYVDSGNNLANSSVLFWDGAGLNVRQAAIGTSVSGVAFEVENTTNAAAGSQQYSPGISLEGQGWKTNATAGSQPVRFRMFVAPIQGAANPTGELVWIPSVNNVDHTVFMRLDSTAVLRFGQGINNDRASFGLATNSLDTEVRGATQNLDLMSNSSNGIRFGTATGSLGSRYQPSSDRLFLGSSTATPNGRLSMTWNNFGSPGEAWGLTWQDVNASFVTRVSMWPSFSGDHRAIIPQSLEVRTNIWIGDSGVLGSFSAPTSLANGLVIASSTAPSANPTTANTTAMYSTSLGLGYRGSVTNEGAGGNFLVHNRNEIVTGAGTDYSLTNTLAAVDFGTTDPSVSLPTAGTYLVFGTLGITGGATPSESYEGQLWNNTDSAAVGTTHKVMGAVASEELEINLLHIVTITAAKTLILRARNEDSASGTVVSTKTTIGYVRLH